MPPPRSFAALGLFVRDNFLSRAERRLLAEQMIAAPREAATIFARQPGGRVDPDVRRAWDVELPAAAASAIDGRISDLREELERHFKVRLRAQEAPSYLVYPPGAFYRPHRDRTGTPDDSHAHARAVSIVVFVNGPGETPSFTGGCLRFYDVLGSDALAEIGIDATPESGTLIAFPSTMLHEVTAVGDGVRCSIVSWFVSAE